MNPEEATSAAALPRTPAIHPLDTLIPASWASRIVDR
jgi:hypothetical protein